MILPRTDLKRVLSHLVFSTPYIPGQGVGKVILMRIYNRWGEVVFEKKDFIPVDGNGSWNGKYKGVESPEGVYVYVAEFECNGGCKVQAKGYSDVDQVKTIGCNNFVASKKSFAEKNSLG